MRTLNIDIETYCDLEIRSAGAYKYAEQADIILFGYSFDNGPVKVVDMFQSTVPDEVMQALTDPNVLKLAFNAAFERAVISQCFYIELPPEQWECTLVRSAMAGLPLNLEDSAKALGLEQQKDTAGKALIRFFCMPCKPTKTNGGRTRNLPEHAPEKWEAFKNYCAQDVVTEQAIGKALSWLKIPAWEKRIWCLDQRINARGLKVDMALARNAIDLDLTFRERLIKEAVDITGLSNTNSVAQIKKWLDLEEGITVTSLNKDSLPGLLKAVKSDKARKIIQIRQDLSKTSVTKYAAMINSAGEGNRVRGLFQYYGASKTGRWAGRLVQVQNLPRGSFGSNLLDGARNLVLGGDLDWLETCFGAIPDTLSQLIRTAFIPERGNRLIISDFSAIEARIIAWFAGETWRLEVFRSHGKIYEASASTMFGIPMAQITKDSPYRQKGKVAELACIHADELVYTDKGYIPIKRIDKDHKLWDGENWVTHGGNIFKGFKAVISYGNLTATKDHLVWVEHMDAPVPFILAAQNSWKLKYTGSQEMVGNLSFKKIEGIHPVYDILNAGPNNRFTVSNVLVHNCGYQGGPGALIRMGAIEQGVVPKEIMDLPDNYKEYFDTKGKRYVITKEKKIKSYLQEIITAWRKASPAIVDLWYTTQTAAMRAIKTHEKIPVAKGMYFQMEGPHLMMHLPSGRFISYPYASIKMKTIVEEYEVIVDGVTLLEEKRHTSETICYWATNQTTRKWEEQDTYGGKLVENWVQAFARDCLAHGLLNLDEAGYPLVGHVHDEAIADVPVGFGSLKEFNALMIKKAPWMGDLPLAAEGFEGTYYKKE